MLFSTVIIHHHGRYFRFQRDDTELSSQVCYWKGAVVLPTEAHPHYRAYVEQKYAPYRQLWAESVFEQEADALTWVAAQLAHDEPTEL